MDLDKYKKAWDNQPEETDKFLRLISIKWHIQSHHQS